MTGNIPVLVWDVLVSMELATCTSEKKPTMLKDKKQVLEKHALIQMAPFFSEGLTFSAKLCKTTYCIYYKIMQSGC